MTLLATKLFVPIASFTNSFYLRTRFGKIKKDINPITNVKLVVK